MPKESSTSRNKSRIERPGMQLNNHCRIAIVLRPVSANAQQLRGTALCETLRGVIVQSLPVVRSRATGNHTDNALLHDPGSNVSTE
jgi:hypothetical protein